MIMVSKAIRQRKCRECHQSIEPGTYHLWANTGGWNGGAENLCINCLKDMVKEIKSGNIATQIDNAIGRLSKVITG